MVMRAKWFSTLLVVAVLLSTAVPTAWAAPSARTTLKGSVPAWANSKNFVGAADANASLGFRVYLGWKNASAAEALARAVSDPNSSQYRQYITAQEFRRQFGPSDAQLASAIQIDLNGLIRGNSHSVLPASLRAPPGTCQSRF